MSLLIVFPAKLNGLNRGLEVDFLILPFMFVLALKVLDTEISPFTSVNPEINAQLETTVKLSVSGVNEKPVPEPVVDT